MNHVSIQAFKAMSFLQILTDILNLKFAIKNFNPDVQQFSV